MNSDTAKETGEKNCALNSLEVISHPHANSHFVCAMSPCTCQVYLISEPALLLVKVHTLTLSHIPTASTTATTQQIQSTYTDSKQHISLKDVKICSNALKPQKQLKPDLNLQGLLELYKCACIVYKWAF